MTRSDRETAERDRGPRTPAPDAGTSDLAERLVAGERRALARAITLVESRRVDHRAQAVALLQTVAERRAAAGKAGSETEPAPALRIGLSGTPGVGKSSFIESFGMRLIEEGLRVAVLAVDPSSQRSGGSILGDKTRMDRLSRSRDAFVRPSPSQNQLGGVARRTRDAITLCEAAGYDVILIETVGVGQSETMVAQMSDLFVLLLAPAGGDELQGVKRGIMEAADLILVNKADGELEEAARRTCADYAGALRLLRRRSQDPPDFPKALMVSAQTGAGLDEAWAQMQALRDWRRQHGHWQGIRDEQAVHWFNEELRAAVLARLEEPGPLRDRLRALENEVRQGRRPAAAAADEMLGLLSGGDKRLTPGEREPIDRGKK